jgi:hypothetical protein
MRTAKNDFHEVAAVDKSRPMEYFIILNYPFLITAGNSFEITTLIDIKKALSDKLSICCQLTERGNLDRSVRCDSY